MQKYRCFKISASPLNLDLLSGAIWELDITGLNEFDDHIIAYCRENSKISKDAIRVILNGFIKENLFESFSVEEKVFENKNWNEEWEKKTRIVKISDNLIIKPSFKKYYPQHNQIIITIDPKMSFGTGEHQTTQLMLQFLEKYIEKGNIVLDVGCGTSILGIAASKLGASQVVAVDNDEWSYLNSKDNVKKNKVENIEFVHGTIDDVTADNFDVVLANINKNVLLEIKESLSLKLRNSGLLLVSGLLKIDFEEIKRQYTKIGFTALELRPFDEWLGIVFKKS